MLSGGFGVGGGVILVPLLTLVYGLDGLVAVGTALPVMIPTAAAGALTYLRADRIRLSDGVKMGLAGAVTAPLGALGAEELGGSAVLVALSVVVLYVAVDVGLRAWRSSAPALGGADPPSGRVPTGLALGIGALAGAVAGLLGLGGGFLIVPLLVRYAHVPIKRAIGTSLSAIAILAIPGAISHVALGNSDLLVAAALALGMVPGAVTGARITLGARERAVQISFAVMLSLVGATLLLRELGVV